MGAPESLPNQEELLVDYAMRLARHRTGRVAVHLRLSGLQPFNRKAHHLRIVEAVFDPLIARYQGQLFRLSNDDLVFVAKDLEKGKLDDAVIKVRYMFRDDPFIERVEDPECGEKFFTLFHLDHDYAAFRSCAQQLQAQCEALARRVENPVALPPDEEEDAKRRARYPLDSAALGRLEHALPNLDLTVILRKQYVYALIGDAPPEPILCERYVSIPALQRLLLPEYDLRADPWLFQRLTVQLDKRVMHDLKDLELPSGIPTSINMHLTSILSREFSAFVGTLKNRTGKAVLLEIPAADLFEDMYKYTFARDFLRASGQKVCIDGLDPVLFATLDRTIIQADLEKVRWSPEYKEALLGDWRDRFQTAVKSAGAAHMVLCHCDDSTAVEFGREMGVRLFQGRYIDYLAHQQHTPAAAQAG